MKGRITKSEAAKQAGVSRRTVIRYAQQGRITQDKRGRVRVTELRAALRPKTTPRAYSIDDYVNAPPGAFVVVQREEAAGLRKKARATEAMLVDMIRHYVEKRKMVAWVLGVLDGLGAGQDFVVLSMHQRAAIEDPV